MCNLKYAIVSGKPTGSQKGLKGTCPVCNNNVFSRKHYWVHETLNEECDRMDHDKVLRKLRLELLDNFSDSLLIRWKAIALGHFSKTSYAGKWGFLKSKLLKAGIKSDCIK